MAPHSSHQGHSVVTMPLDIALYNAPSNDPFVPNNSYKQYVINKSQRGQRQRQLPLLDDDVSFKVLLLRVHLFSCFAFFAVSMVTLFCFGFFWHLLACSYLHLSYLFPFILLKAWKFKFFTAMVLAKEKHFAFTCNFLFYNRSCLFYF